MSFAEGDELEVVDRGDGEWWKVQVGGEVKVVPAVYLEVEG